MAFAIEVSGQLLLPCSSEGQAHAVLYAGAHGDAEVEQHAAARIRGENELAVHASDDTGAHVLIVEMAA
jgi:hypothetical protein